jgi:hypothetical protein
MDIAVERAATATSTASPGQDADTATQTELAGRPTGTLAV